MLAGRAAGPVATGCGWSTGHVRAGFRLVDAGVVVLGGHELFHREQTSAGRCRAAGSKSRAIDSFLDLNEGDLVVHVSHGIARFRGMQMLECDDGTAGSTPRSTSSLEFRDGVMLYVPASKIDLVQKYVGGGKTDPELSKLGGTALGQARRTGSQEAVLDLAAEMIQLQAVREAQPGIAFPPDTDWQREFEAAFPYQETPDQLTAIERDQARHGAAAADGPPDLRRRRLRQDRAGHPRRVQGRRQRQAGRRPRADDRAGRAALPHLQRSGWPSTRSPSRSSAGSAPPASRSEILKRLADGERRRHHRHAPARSART